MSASVRFVACAALARVRKLGSIVPRHIRSWKLCVVARTGHLCASRARNGRAHIFGALILAAFPVLTGCLPSHQLGPERPIAITDDVETIRRLAEPDLSDFYNRSPASQTALRNHVITARMYIIDLQYHKYEANLTRELQTEGLLATAINLGLTGSASLIPVAQTDRLLSGIATGVTGLDKAYNEKELLSHTIQALQTQMRADRNTQAATIYQQMKTSIDEFPLPMALSAVDAYYQAGTISSALIGLSKTVANAEQNAEDAKAKSGPNAAGVTAVKTIAAPLPNQVRVTLPPSKPVVISSATIPLATLPRSPAIPGEPTDPMTIANIRRALCLDPSGSLDEMAHSRLNTWLDVVDAANKPHSGKFLAREMIFLNRLISRSQTADCTIFRS